MRPTSSRSRRKSSSASSPRSGRTRCCRRWAARPRSTRRWRWRARGRCSATASSSSAPRKKPSPKRRLIRSLDEAVAALGVVCLPAIIRPSFTLGGTGGGVAYNNTEFEEIVRGGLRASPTHEVLIEESVLGWKEYEMEVVRDRADNCIIICSIENVDPMGVHTGDSVTVAPALTLTDKE